MVSPSGPTTLQVVLVISLGFIDFPYYDTVFSIKYRLKNLQHLHIIHSRALIACSTSSCNPEGPNTAAMTNDHSHIGHCFCNIFFNHLDRDIGRNIIDFVT